MWNLNLIILISLEQESILGAVSLRELSQYKFLMLSGQCHSLWHLKTEVGTVLGDKYCGF